MNVHLALLHYPVYDRQRQVVVSSVTNLDIHDIARAALTYGVRRFYPITPLGDQLQLIHRILAHWQTGHGATRHPERRLALELVTPSTTLTDVIAAITRDCGQKPELLVTSASLPDATLSYEQARRKIQGGEPLLILFGTGWGLSNEVMEIADHSLAPIQGCSPYNHLSVRCAAAIILDRLLGPVNDR